MKTGAVNTINKIKNLYADLKSILGKYSSDKRFVNAILYANCGVVLLFAGMIFFLNQKQILNYMDIREAVGRLKEVSDSYNYQLTRAQITLRPDIEKIKQLLDDTKAEYNNISGLTDEISSKTYTQKIKAYTDTLNKRLVISDELINKYVDLSHIYSDYKIASDNAENVARDNVELQLTIKHIMLDLENARLIMADQNRNGVLVKINQLRNSLIDSPAIIQEKIGLFVERADKIISILRYLDTVRNSMNSDMHNQLLEDVKQETADSIFYEGLKFAGKILVFFILSAILILGQFVLLTVFFITKRRTEKLQKESHQRIAKSVEIADRAKTYALDAQRSQYKLLQNFCGDFDTVITTISELSDRLKKAFEAQQSDENILNQQKISVSTLNASVIALERWLANYLELYTSQDSWTEVTQSEINITELFDKHFAESRFFIKDRMHALSIFHDEIPGNIQADKDYLQKLFINMMYISVKWAHDNWLRSAITLEKVEPADDDDDEETKSFLKVSVINGASKDQYELANMLFQKNEVDLEAQKDHDGKNIQNDPHDNSNQDDLSKNTEIDTDDRFIIASFYYIRQICDLLKATLEFERSVKEENILSVKVPITFHQQAEVDIGVPLLMNKNVLIVSPYGPVLSSIENQLRSFNLNVTSLSDRYSAIGHIVGGSNQEQKYDLFIIDHNPPEIDALSLVKVIRENTLKNLAHIIIMTTEEHSVDLEQHRSLYDHCFTKPLMPQLLKSKLEEFVEIQLYGLPTEEDEIVSEEEEEKIYRFLVGMDEDLSTLLMRMILTKTNYHVDIVSSTPQIFERLEDNLYDYVLVSNKCSWLNPDSLAADIRRHHSDNKETVLIMIHDEITDAIYKRYVRCGYDDFFPLPLSKTEFIELIEKWEDPMAQRLNDGDKAQEGADANTTKTNNSEQSDDQNDTSNDDNVIIDGEESNAS